MLLPSRRAAVFVGTGLLLLTFVSLSVHSAHREPPTPLYAHYLKSPWGSHTADHVSNPSGPLQAPQLVFPTDRGPDTSDTFSTYLHSTECGLNSLDLHVPIQPLCSSRDAVLRAMSSGGRAGFDQPYIPLGCDFRWYTTAEICTILGRFSHIFVIGDSLQRMLMTAMYTLLRQDLGVGGVAEWEFLEVASSLPGATTDLEDCLCENQYRKHECSHSYIRSYSNLVGNSSSLNAPACASMDGTQLPFEMTYHEWQGYPPSEKEREDLLSSLPDPTLQSEKPYAFILHHTFWNNVNVTETVSWLDEVVETLTDHLPSLPPPDEGNTYKSGTQGFPRLFVTANAPGIRTDMITLDGRTSQSVAKFEKEIQPHLQLRDIDMLGFYNMSVQTSSNDNVHSNMRTNLLKAMMVLNWLDWTGKIENHS